LNYIRKVGSFDASASKFYSAEIAVALEYLHDLGIIHRDLKPENILLNEDMHILVTDFGTAKALEEGEEKAKSFVGTAEYVSPELLQDKVTYTSSDVWALGCIIYQFIAGRSPFHAPNEYLCFQKIIKLDYSFPEGFDEVAADVIRKILVQDHTKRLGCAAMGGYKTLQEHPFFEGIEWDTLTRAEPPKILPYLPSNTKDGENLKSDYDEARHSSDDDFEERFLAAWNLGDTSSHPRTASVQEKEDREKLLKKQATDSPWHRFVNNEFIMKQGLVDKRKGLFAKRRMLILTDAPRLYYVDPMAMELKGEIPWSEALQVEQKNWKIFFVHTPNRTYYLEDPTGNSQAWSEAIEKCMKLYKQKKKGGKS
jgi:3-phosphoinositide dependent protein kinase-1